MIVAGCQDTVSEVVGEVESRCPPFVLSLLIPQQGSHNLECLAPEHLSTAITTLAMRWRVFCGNVTAGVERCKFLFTGGVECCHAVKGLKFASVVTAEILAFESILDHLFAIESLPCVERIALILQWVDPASAAAVVDETDGILSASNASCW